MFIIISSKLLRAESIINIIAVKYEFKIKSIPFKNLLMSPKHSEITGKQYIIFQLK